MSEEKLNTIKLGLHLKYCIIIFLIISCVVGGLALFNQTIAINGLSNAGLLLSIVLAVIAILMSLWDVSGQRNSVYEIKEQMQLIRNITDEIKDSSVSSKEILEKLENINERFSMDFEPIKNSIEQMNKKLESSPDEVGGIRNSMNEIAKLIEEKEKDMSVVKKTLGDIKSINQNQTSSFVLRYIRKLKVGNEFSVKDVVVGLLKNYQNNYKEEVSVKFATVSETLDSLVEFGDLEKVSKEVYRKT